jgi:hypothetical protein
MAIDADRTTFVFRNVGTLPHDLKIGGKPG